VTNNYKNCEFRWNC